MQFAQTSASYYENEEKDFEWSEPELDEIANSTEFILKDRMKSQKTIQKIAATPFDVHSCYLSRMVESKRAHDIIQRCYSGINSFFYGSFRKYFPVYYAQQTDRQCLQIEL
jgi:hypothetical protein